MIPLATVGSSHQSSTFERGGATDTTSTPPPSPTTRYARPGSRSVVYFVRTSGKSQVSLPDVSAPESNPDLDLADPRAGRAGRGFREIWRRRELNPRPRTRADGIYERIPRSDLI